MSPGARLLPRLATLEGSGWVGRTEPWLGGLWQARWLEATLWLGVLGPREWLCEFRLGTPMAGVGAICGEPLCF